MNTKVMRSEFTHLSQMHAELNRLFGEAHLGSEVLRLKGLLLDNDISPNAPGKVIAGFPGVGKSYITRQNPVDCSDSDSSLFHWLDGSSIGQPDIPHPDWPNNYIQHIKQQLRRREFVFVSTHTEVLDALRRNDISYYLLMPRVDRRDEFIERYRQRGSSREFIERLSANWNSFLDSCRLAATRHMQQKLTLGVGVDVTMELLREITKD